MHKVSTLVDSKSAGQGKELTEASRRLEISEIHVVPRKEQNCIDNYTSQTDIIQKSRPTEQQSLFFVILICINQVWSRCSSNSNLKLAL